MSWITYTITMNTSEKAWFDEWFDTTYYHILYQQRNDDEAHFFIDNLARFLQFSPSDNLLDLACGKGRHAIYLNSKGLQVIGVDLSANSIAHASLVGNERLHFERHDMRDIYKPNYFDYVLNMFTSFGYFDTDAENQATISAAADNLKVGGKLVLDFFNAVKIINNLVDYEQKTLNDITFTITKRFSSNFILKNIHFVVNEQHFHFQEKVQAISLHQFETYFKKANFNILHTFGGYDLTEFDLYSSDRLIFIVEKHA